MNRNSTFFLALMLWALVSNAQQNDKYEKDLQKLRENYTQAVERALEPVNKRYIHELEALLKRTTFDGDLNTAVKVKKELDRLKGEQSSSMAASPFVGQWEYEISGRTYRRIIRADGSAELWRGGSIWKKSSGAPYWKGFT